MYKWIPLLAWTQLDSLPTDTLPELLPIEQKFDVVLYKTFPVQTVLSDTFPLQSGFSGANVLALAVYFKLNRRLDVVLRPGVNFHKYHFAAKGASILPGTEKLPPTYTYQKWRTFYGQLQGGLRWSVKTSSHRRPLIWISAGATAQLLFASSLKYRYENEGFVYKVRTQKIPDLNNFRWGLYGEIMYKWIGLIFTYHGTPYWRSGTYTENNVVRSFPTSPQWEVGIVLAL
ncbi:MAG: hypothetical protein ACUVRD_02000 [Bacteroidia bacterium]